MLKTKAIMTHCAYCNQSVPPKIQQNGLPKLYCSMICKTRAQNIKRKARKWKAYTAHFTANKRECPMCREHFLPPFRGGRHKRFCSIACKMDHDVKKANARRFKRDPDARMDEKWENQVRLSRQREVLAKLRIAFASGPGGIPDKTKEGRAEYKRGYAEGYLRVIEEKNGRQALKE